MIQTFRKSQFAELKQWWDTGVPFLPRPSDSWLAYVFGNENVHCFCSLLDGQIAVHSQTDIEDTVGYIAIVTNPSFLRSGHASKHLHEVEQRLASLGVQRLIASVEIDNNPSIAFFEKNGYVPKENAELDDSLANYEKEIQQALSSAS